VPTYNTTILSDPGRVSVNDAEGKLLAIFTQGCSTVLLAGPERTFLSSTTARTISHTYWVRTLPAPFLGNIDLIWLEQALLANKFLCLDVLAIAMQYTETQPVLYEGELQIAGEASYGWVQRNGKFEEGADFSDYLGVTWLYQDGDRDGPEKRQKGCLDCSGFIRMIWGFRHHLPHTTYKTGIPLCREPKENGSALPRRATQMRNDAPGIVIREQDRGRLTDLSRLQVGDLVFFDGDKSDGKDIDHVGMFMGVDDNGKHRFISSRKSLDGPTMGDSNSGMSVLDLPGQHYTEALRVIRRL
jgi:hypothetical protein